MAKRKTKKQNPITLIIVIIVALCGLLTGKFIGDSDPTETEPVGTSTDIVSVHIIDVGQGSSALIKSGDKGILIDVGEKEYAQTVIDYLKNSGIKKLEYVVASHPHSDHIGGLTEVLDAFPTENIIMPELSASNMPTTRTYEKLLLKIDEKNINVLSAEFGESYLLGNAKLEVFGPVKQDKDLNNMSVICKVTSQNTSVLFPGDAEKEEMESVLAYSPNLKCDVYVMAHHGSNTSLEKDFLKKVNPSVAVISCGKGNSYGHPHKEILNYLNQNKIETYRTDLQGNIMFTVLENNYVINSGF